MTAKIVYTQNLVQITFSGEDLEPLLKGDAVKPPLYIAGQFIAPEACIVLLGFHACKAIKAARQVVEAQDELNQRKARAAKARKAALEKAERDAEA